MLQYMCKAVEWWCLLWDKWGSAPLMIDSGHCKLGEWAWMQFTVPSFLCPLQLLARIESSLIPHLASYFNGISMLKIIRVQKGRNKMVPLQPCVARLFKGKDSTILVQGSFPSLFDCSQTKLIKFLEHLFFLCFSKSFLLFFLYSSLAY